MALTPELLVVNWTNDRVIKWIESLHIFHNTEDDNNWKIVFKEVTGPKLLTLTQNGTYIDQYISQQSKPQIIQFQQELDSLVNFEQKLQSELSTFLRLKSQIITALQSIKNNFSIMTVNANCAAAGGYLYKIDRVSHNVSLKQYELFEYELSLLMKDILPLISKVLKDAPSINTSISFFVGNLMAHPDTITYKDWIQSGFIYDIMMKFQSKLLNLHDKRMALRCIANMASNSTRNESLKRVFSEIDVISIMYQYIINNAIKSETDENNKYTVKNAHDYPDLLFPFRVILFLCDSSKNDKCKWIINKTYAVKWLFVEYDNALKHKLYLNFLPDAYDRSITVNKLYNNQDKELQRLLLQRREDGGYMIMNYLARSLVYEEKTIHETRVLYANVCECLYKISMDLERNLSLLFEFQFQCLAGENILNNKMLNVDMWTRLNSIMINTQEFKTAARFSKLIQRNIHNYYIDVFREYSLMCFSSDIIFEIASWIW